MAARARKAATSHWRRAWCAAAVVAVGIQMSAPPAGAAAAPTKVMPLGDSITDGYNVPGGYRIALEDLLAEDRHSVDFVGSKANGPASLLDREHEGHSGWRIDEIAANVDGWLGAHQPDVVLLKIGTNDVLQRYDLVDAPRRLSELIDRITVAVPSATILVSTLPPLGTTERDDRVRSFNAALPAIVNDKVGRGKDVELVDMYPALSAGDLADGVHPTSGGYDKIATVWQSALEGVLPSPK